MDTNLIQLDTEEANVPTYADNDDDLIFEVSIQSFLVCNLKRCYFKAFYPVPDSISSFLPFPHFHFSLEIFFPSDIIEQELVSPRVRGQSDLSPCNLDSIGPQVHCLSLGRPDMRFLCQWRTKPNHGLGRVTIARWLPTVHQA